MKLLFPTATILPPVNDEMQHCCVIRNPEKTTSQFRGSKLKLEL
jgi:hypothetical protein